MGLKLGLIVGFSVGYMLGAKAGRGRYEQIKRCASKMRKNPAIGRPLDAIGERASDIVRMGGERVTDSIADAVKERMFGATSSSLAGERAEMRVSETELSGRYIDRERGSWNR